MVRIMTESVWLGSWNVNRFNAAGVLAKYNIVHCAASCSRFQFSGCTIKPGIRYLEYPSSLMQAARNWAIFSRTIARGKTLAPPKAILMNTA
jgi:hypothetical protein